VSVRVLIVDDQAPFRLAARFVVEATDGFDVVAEVETGEDAVAVAAELLPDLVLMDVNLPGIDGLEATRRIREQSEGAVTVLLLSTYEAEDYAGRAVECGAAGFIPKSQFGPDRLAEAWERAAAA
jgi:DNA-binding NarL/FixJ family response regulator